MVCMQSRVQDSNIICNGNCCNDLTASATVHHHARQHAEYNVGLMIEVQHRDGRHLAGRATWPCARVLARPVGHLRQMGVRVPLQEHQRTLAGTVVSLVPLRRDDPVPAEVLEIHC